MVRRPTRSATQTSGRNTGPWLEKMSRNGSSPLRIARADDREHAVVEHQRLLAKNAGRRITTVATARTSASVRQCADRTGSGRPGERPPSRPPSAPTREASRHGIQRRSSAGARLVAEVVWYGRLPSDLRTRSDEREGLGEAHLRDRWRGLQPGQGPHRLLARPPAQVPWPPGHDAEARPLHQRRPGHDEPLPARRSVRHRRRRRDRPRPRPLRALRRRAR